MNCLIFCVRDGLTVEDSAGKITELNEQQKSGMDAAKLLAEMGLDVTVYASTEADRKAGMENGNIRLSDGSIRVDLNAGADGQGVMAFALSHEFTHFVEEMSPAKFQAFTDILFEEMGKKGADVSALIEAKAQALGKMEENKSLSENKLNDLAYSEVTAEMMETALTDTDLMERISARLQQTDKSLWGKIKDFLKGLVDRLKAAYKGMNPDSGIAQLARETINSSERVLDAFADAASDAVVNYRLQDGQKNNAAEGVQYSLREYTEQQKKNWENSKRIVVYNNQQQFTQFISDSIADKTMDKKMYFGAIPSDLAARINSDTGVDVEGYNLSLGSYEVRKILKDHGNAAKEATRGQRAIVADDFGHITDIVLNPTKITLSEQDYMGKPAIIFSGDHNGKMNVVAVVSDKRLDLFVQTVYTNVKKGNLATPTGEQAPINTPEANGSTVSGNSIRNSSEDVKEILKSSRDSEGNVLTEAQEKYFEDSQVRDDDGNLIPVYHKTSNEVTVFKRGKLGENTLYNANDASLAATSLVGHWFSDSENTPFMGDAIKSYLNITNPYYTSLDELAADIGDYASNLEVMQEHFENGQFNMVRNAARGYVNWMRWRGYDGLIVNDSETGGTSYVILDSRQAKLTTNESPTGVRDIRYSSRQRAEVEQALEEYRAQQNEEFRTMKAAYDTARAKIAQEYKLEMEQMESLSGEITARYQNEFLDALMDTEDLGKKGIPQLRKQFRELAEKNSGEDAQALSARKAEYNRLLDEFLKNRDIGKLRVTIQQQRSRAKAKVENSRKTVQRGKLERTVAEINRRLLNPSKTLYVPDSLQPAVTMAMEAITNKGGLLYMPCDINSAFYISIAIPVADMLFEQALADTI